tara:strand:+ start:376 stop:1368 length:993 start_codon:yes stop_codon:yes gene_type:complete
MSVKKTNILYIFSGETGFKQKDELLLCEIGKLKKLNLLSIADYVNLKNLSLIKWCDAVFIWFASFHAVPFILLNQFYNKQIYIIAGGYDVANLPEINYGSMAFGFRRQMGQWLLKHAYRIIAVSNSNRNEIIQNCNVHPKRINLIYNAIDLKKSDQIRPKKNQILSVGEINEETVLRKGLDRFIHISKAFPNIEFIHIGKWTDKHGKPSNNALSKLKSDAPRNVKFLGFVSEDILIKNFRESRIYLQLSRHEAFGVSVLEAMKYDCVPIVTNAYALPEVVGKNGFIIQNQTECISAIKAVLKNQYFQKNKINPLFDLSQRKAAFERLLAN